MTPTSTAKPSPRAATGAVTLLVAAALVLPVPAAAHGRAHQHGVATLDVVVDGPTLTLTLDSPLDNLLGFERAPRTDAERRRAQAMADRLRAPADLVRTDAAAGCTPGTTTLEAPVLGLGPGGAAGGDHADLSATIAFTCATPTALRSADLSGLFKAWPGFRRIDTQVAGPAGQRKRTLTPAAPRIELR